MLIIIYHSILYVPVAILNLNFSGYSPGGPLLENFRNTNVTKNRVRDEKSDLDLVQARPWITLETRTTTSLDI